MPRMQIAVQLYTVRDATAKDMLATLREVRKIGFKSVELAGHGNLKTPSEVRQAMDDAGVTACGAHVGIESLQKNLEQVLDDHVVMGVPNVIVPFINETWRSADGYRRLAEEVTRFAEAAESRGISVGYHNHSFEFQKYDGQTGMDILWSNSDPKKVRSELDLYWVRHADVDPAAYIGQLSDRLSIVHLKDMSREDRNKFAPVGSGIMDFGAILEATKLAGVKWGVVEQDRCYDTPPMDALRQSYDYLQSIKAV